MGWWNNRFFRALQFNVEDPFGYYADKIDSEYLVELAEKAHANMLIVFARDAWGRVFYSGSRLYPRHANSRLDVTELSRKARERGIRVVVMSNHTANRYIYRKHPRWAQRNREGEVIVLEHYPAAEKVVDPHWPQICPNSPAMELYFVPEAEEASSLSGADGVLLDSFRYMPDPPRACYCEYCRSKFRREHGLDLPERESPEDEAFRLAWEWRYNVVVEALEKLRKAVKGSNPNSFFFFNSHPAGWAGRGNIIVEKARELLDGVFAEMSEADITDYTTDIIAVKLSKAVVGRGKPVFASRNLFYALRTVQSAPPVTVRQGIRAIVAAGGQPIATLFPSQAFSDPRAIDYLAEVYEELEVLEDYLVNTDPIRYAGIIFDSDTHEKYYWHRPDFYVSEIEGIAQIFSHSHMPWEIVSMRDIAEPDGIEKYPVLVAAGTTVVGEEEEAALREYVFSGGFLIATHEFGIMRPDYTYREALALQDLFGVSYEGVFLFGYSFLDLRGDSQELYREYWDGMPESVVFGDHSAAFVRERFEPRFGELVRARPAGSKILAYGRLGRSAYGYEYTLGRSTPAPDSTLRVVGISYNRAGRGQTLYYSVRLGAHYSRLGHPDYAQLLLRPLRRHAPRPLVEVEAPETVQSEPYRQGDRIIVHVVNHTYNQRILTAPMGPGKQAPPAFIPSYNVHPARIVLPVYGLRLRVNRDLEGYHAFNPLTGAELNVSRGDGWASIDIGKLDEYACIVIEPRG